MWLFLSILLALASSFFSVTAEADFEPWIQKQNWDPATDDLLEMLVETYAKYNARLNFGEPFQETNPVIGILTMDPDVMEIDEEFGHDHFIWEGNVNLIHYAGSWAVPIRWDIGEEDLYELLGSINGVLFTGGAMPLVDHETGAQSTYYQTAKRIFEYAKA